MTDKNKIVDKESYSLACLKMARSALSQLEAEIRLYNSANGKRPLEVSFTDLRETLDQKVHRHKKRLHNAQNGIVPKKKKKKRRLKKKTLVEG